MRCFRGHTASVGEEPDEGAIATPMQFVLHEHLYVRPHPYLGRQMNEERAREKMNQVADRIDLAIDLFTLGQYGLEQIDPPGEQATGPCAGARTRRSPLRPKSPSRSVRRRTVAHNEYEWGWPSPDADGGPSTASSLWALAHS